MWAAATLAGTPRPAGLPRAAGRSPAAAATEGETHGVGQAARSPCRGKGEPAPVVIEGNLHVLALTPRPLPCREPPAPQARGSSAVSSDP
mmetsp:Transcript_125384/g.348899  ORF Transcript_125384/g.348899 Transcript_125384/m.348899 type:complete len:90 (+) Transcript_125384:544-813(+)